MNFWRELKQKWHIYTVKSGSFVHACDLRRVYISYCREAYEDEKSEVEQIFNGLAKTWREATGGYSLTYRRYVHPSYQAILTLGKDVVPFMLRELQTKPDRWFEALKVLTGQNPAEKSKTFDDAVHCWLEWGKENGFIP